MTPNQLPPLPPAAVDEHNLQGGRLLYTRQQMHAYALTALAQQAQAERAASQVVIYSPIEVSPHAEKFGRHPNDNEPRDDEMSQYLDERGDQDGQGLSIYWKWGYRAGWNDHKRHAAKTAQQAQGEPVYQVRGAFDADPVNTWRDTTETAFFFHPVNQRRILYTTPQPAPQVPVKCLTCNGHGLIGGRMPDGSGHGEPCPDCNAPQVPAPVDEREAFEAWAKSVGYHTGRDMFQIDKYESSITWELWLVWQARAALQSPAPQATKGQS